MSHSDKKEVTLDGNDSLTVTTPDGVVIISCLRAIGTQVMVYEDPERNPLGYIHLKEA